MSSPLDIKTSFYTYHRDIKKGVCVIRFSYAALGNTIRALRKERKLSQEVLSGLAGIARTHLTMIENGTMHPNIETVWKIALALDLLPSELFSYVESNTDEEEKE